MKIVRTEFGHEYATYRFGYCEYAELEAGDDLESIYAQGFLPYSAEPSIQGRFYMARSARLDLQQLRDTSENRRIDKKFEGLFTSKRLSVEQAKQEPQIRELFLEYFRLRHGDVVMPAERFDAILETPLPLEVVVYRKEGVLVAAALEIAGKDFRHFWFSAYDLSYAQQSLGMWLMQAGARAAQAAGKEHYYLGTVYGEKALYKTNLEPLEFWDGTSWSADCTALRTLARGESKTS